MVIVARAVRNIVRNIEAAMAMDENRKENTGKISFKYIMITMNTCIMKRTRVWMIFFSLLLFHRANYHQTDTSLFNVSNDTWSVRMRYTHTLYYEDTVGQTERTRWNEINEERKRECKSKRENLINTVSNRKLMHLISRIPKIRWHRTF